MKINHHNPAISFLLIIFLATFSSCEKNLDEELFSQFAPDNFLINEKGINSLLVAAYNHIQYMDFVGTQYNYLGEAPTDLFWETGGGHNRDAFPLINFSWDNNHPWVYNTGWVLPYATIRDVNLLLDNLDKVPLIETEKNRIKGEAVALRAFSYNLLFGWFGPTPLVVSSNGEDKFPKRATAQEMKSFIETELTQAASLLPVDQKEYGRITKGAALSLLTKFYLNTKQWDKAAAASQQVMALNKYSLFADYTKLFEYENEGNPELIMVLPSLRLSGEGNTWMAFSRPPNYPILPNQANFAAQFRYYDAFVNSFALNDNRRKLFLTEYTDNQGKLIKLLGDDNSRSFKYNDPNSNAEYQENDFVILRYADILLSRAEALNEISGPAQAVIDLINAVRRRANVTLLNLGDFTGKDALRSHILKERSWEFYSESLRREDLIRHGKFIEQAVLRGKSAQPRHVLYPIPQREIDVNPNLVQNEGY